MRVISIDKVEPGMQVGRNIYGSNGEILLAAGVKITPKYIQRLHDIGIVAIYIHDDVLGDIEIDDVVSEKTRIEAVKVTKEVMSNIKVNPAIDVNKVNNVVNSIIDDLLSNKNIVINLVDIRAMNDYTFGHSVNVAIMSIIIGIALKYDQLKLRNLAAGALFHDIGKTMIPEEILNKTGELTKTEEEQLKQHTNLGFEILRKIDNFSLLSAHVALQHHERYDGSGYPRNLKGNEISDFARIVTIADVYDGMTTDRVGQPRLAPYQAVELIIANRGKFFDPDIVEKFIHSIALFPLGTMVLLNTGEKGAVVKTYKEHPTRPKIRILVDRRGKNVKPPYDIDLAKNSKYCIIRVLEEA